jgi:hypothetical protein
MLNALEMIETIPLFAVPCPLTAVHSENYANAKRYEAANIWDEVNDDKTKRPVNAIAYAPNPIEEESTPIPFFYFRNNFIVRILRFMALPIA